MDVGRAATSCILVSLRRESGFSSFGFSFWGGRRDEEMVRSYFGALDAQMGLLVDRVPGR